MWRSLTLRTPERATPREEEEEQDRPQRAASTDAGRMEQPALDTGYVASIGAGVGPTSPVLPVSAAGVAAAAAAAAAANAGHGGGGGAVVSDANAGGEPSMAASTPNSSSDTGRAGVHGGATTGAPSMASTGTAARQEWQQLGQEGSASSSAHEPALATAHGRLGSAAGAPSAVPAQLDTTVVGSDALLTELSCSMASNDPPSFSSILSDEDEPSSTMGQPPPKAVDVSASGTLNKLLNVLRAGAAAHAQYDHLCADAFTQHGALLHSAAANADGGATAAMRHAAGRKDEILGLLRREKHSIRRLLRKAAADPPVGWLGSDSGNTTAGGDHGLQLAVAAVQEAVVEQTIFCLQSDRQEELPIVPRVKGGSSGRLMLGVSMGQELCSSAMQYIKASAEAHQAMSDVFSQQLSASMAGAEDQEALDEALQLWDQTVRKVRQVAVGIKPPPVDDDEYGFEESAGSDSDSEQAADATLVLDTPGAQTAADGLSLAWRKLIAPEAEAADVRMSFLEHEDDAEARSSEVELRNSMTDLRALMADNCSLEYSLAEQREEYVAQVDDLRSQNRQIIEQTDQEKTELRQEITSLQQQVALLPAQESLTELERENASLRQRVVDLEQDSARRQEQMAQQLLQFESSTLARTQLEEQLRLQQTAFSELKAQLEALGSSEEFTQLHSENKRLEEIAESVPLLELEISELKEQSLSHLVRGTAPLQTLTDQNAQLERRVVSVERELAVAQQESATLRDRLEQRESYAAGLEHRIVGLNASNAQLQEHVDSAVAIRSEVEALQLENDDLLAASQLHELESDVLSALQKRLGEAEQSGSAATADVDDILAANAALQSEVDALRSAEAAMQATSAARYEDVLADCARLRAQLDKLSQSHLLSIDAMTQTNLDLVDATVESAEQVTTENQSDESQSVDAKSRLYPQADIQELEKDIFSLLQRRFGTLEQPEGAAVECDDVQSAGARPTMDLHVTDAQNAVNVELYVTCTVATQTDMQLSPVALALHGLPSPITPDTLDASTSAEQVHTLSYIDLSSTTAQEEFATPMMAPGQPFSPQSDSSPIQHQTSGEAGKAAFGALSPSPVAAALGIELASVHTDLDSLRQRYDALVAEHEVLQENHTMLTAKCMRLERDLHSSTSLKQAAAASPGSWRAASADTTTDEQDDVIITTPTGSVVLPASVSSADEREQTPNTRSSMQEHSPESEARTIAALERLNVHLQAECDAFKAEAQRLIQQSTAQQDSLQQANLVLQEQLATRQPQQAQDDDAAQLELIEELRRENAELAELSVTLKTECRAAQQE
eukprot:SAG25_NODE_926_length_4735_cov_17.808671_1_plen_1303_part_01